MIDSAKDLVVELAYQFAKQKLGFSSAGLALSAGGAGGVSGGLNFGGSAVGSFLAQNGINLGGVGTGGIVGNIASQWGLTGGGSAAGQAISQIPGLAGVDPATGLLRGTPGAVGEGTVLRPGQGGGFSFNAMAALKSAGLSFAGGFAGQKLGSAITGKTANSNIGATIGSIILPGIGSAIGGFLDSVFGSDKSRWLELRPGQHPLDQRGFDGANIGKVSRSEFGAVTVNTVGKPFEGASRDQVQPILDMFDVLA
ncbi:MAG: hypothetical protein U5O39_00400 [Gammaproteobacteria bacterium]|nr:hypothetical protein [Gammaproteobacteria bacterium]